MSSGAASQSWLHKYNHLGNAHIFKNTDVQFSLVDDLIQIEIDFCFGNLFKIIR